MYVVLIMNSNFLLGTGFLFAEAFLTQLSLVLASCPVPIQPSAPGR